MLGVLFCSHVVDDGDVADMHCGKGARCADVRR